MGKEGDDVWFADVTEIPDVVRAHIADHRTELDKKAKQDREERRRRM